jgi:hypothetical protein
MSASSPPAPARRLRKARASAYSSSQRGQILRRFKCSKATGTPVDIRASGKRRCSCSVVGVAGYNHFDERGAPKPGGI